MQYPHCDARILHAPGQCVYCDSHPEWQELRKTWNINFTGEYDREKDLCPAERSRGNLNQIEKWGGNRPTTTTNNLAPLVVVWDTGQSAAQLTPPKMPASATPEKCFYCANTWCVDCLNYQGQTLGTSCKCEHEIIRPKEPKKDPRTTLSGKPPVNQAGSAPGTIQSNGMYSDYWILSDEERAKGWVRPLRDTYQHKKCGAVTKMGRLLAETYARDPKFYTHTYCVRCQTHPPVQEFVWDVDGETVGS